MSEGKTDTKSQDEPPCIGTPMSDFEGTIDVLATTRDAGNCTIMLTRSGTVRVVGNEEDIQHAIMERLQRPVTTDDVSAILTEVKNFCQTAMHFSKLETALAFIVDNVYDDELKELSDEPKREAAKNQLQRKLDLSASLVPSATKERQRRLRTATQASLEDVDIELVRERRDDLRGIKVEQQFLRLRFRYTDEKVSASFPLWFFRAPWGGLGGDACGAFELECDEVDIDVLLYRLSEAKRLLLSTDEKVDSATNNDNS
jgi:hypothetical protein